MRRRNVLNPTARGTDNTESKEELMEQHEDKSNRNVISKLYRDYSMTELLKPTAKSFVRNVCIHVFV